MAEQSQPIVGTGCRPAELRRRNLPRIAYWYQDSGIVVVRFDGDNQVAEKQLVDVSTFHQKVNRFRERPGW
ncbi:MAG: hypothetical protein U0992_23705 [Planctomycetaceae bacterium]